MRVTTGLSQIASNEQADAVGSVIRFVIEETDGQTTLCSMWLAESAQRLSFANDARFMKPYMRAVEDELRLIDPSVALLKE